MLDTIDKQIAAFQYLKSIYGGDAHVAVFSRIVTEKEAKKLVDCSFAAVHSQIDETIEEETK